MRHLKDKLRLLFRAYKYGFVKDRAEIGFIRSLDLKGKTVLDIGAHKGAYSYWLLKNVGSTGHLFAFEPQADLYKKLEKTLIPYGNVTIENIGLSSEEGKADFFIPDSASGSSPSASFENVVVGDNYQTRKVLITTLDRYVENNKIQSIQFIKCDAEGHERKILEGGAATLKRFKPTILVECERRHLDGAPITDLFDFLMSFGYKGQFVLDGQLYPLAQFDAEKHQKYGEGQFWEEPGYANNFIFM